jgi:hypothetical protein
MPTCLNVPSRFRSKVLFEPRHCNNYGKFGFVESIPKTNLQNETVHGRSSFVVDGLHQSAPLPVTIGNNRYFLHFPLFNMVAFEFDFINGGFLNEEDDIFSSLYNKSQPQTTQEDISLVAEDNTFTSLSNIINVQNLPDSPDSWVSNSSISDNDEDVELCEFTSAGNIQKQQATNKKMVNKQPPVMTAPLPTSFMPNMNFGMQPPVFQSNMMDAYMGAQMMPNMMPMMSPQQIMFLQQQQQTFNAMNNMGFQPTTFIPAPAPPKKQTKNSTSPVKQERASPPAKVNNKSTLKRRRDSQAKNEIAEEMDDSPIRETNSANSSPTSSPSSSPTPGESETKPGKDKDVKRQRRLIKNRESAQASRERKKIYVQGLEKRVDDLAQTNTTLSSKVLTLEEENILLREKLLSLDRDGSISQELNEPSFKKRRLAGQQQPKIPIPSLQAGTSFNPFTNGFWNAFMGFAPPHLQNAQSGTSWNPGAQSKKVVLFVMLFCVAVLVMSNSKKHHMDVPNIAVNTAEGKGSFNIPEETVRRVGRNILHVKQEDLPPFFERVQPIMEEFFTIQNTTSAEETEEDKKKKKQQCLPNEAEEEADNSSVSMEYDEEKGLVLTFPIDNINKVKTEPGVELTKDMKMDRLSQRFIEELCKELKH